MEIQIPVFDDIETKPIKRGERLLRSESARHRRRKTKQVIETRTLNEWAQLHRKKKQK